MNAYIPPRIKKFFHYAITGVSSACLIAIAIFAVALKMPLLNSWQAFTIETGSMEPTIPTDSLIFTRKPTSPDTIKIGDIITFEQPGFQNKLITHRIHAIDESGSFITKGDANGEVDDWVVPFGRVRGLGNWNLPYLGRAINTVRSPLGIALFVALPVIIVLWQEGRNIINILVEKKLERFFKHLKRAGYQVIPPPRTNNPPAHPAASPQKFTIIKPAQSITHHARRTITQPTRKLTITTTAILLSLLASPALAFFISNSVTVANNTITTAATFPSGSPNPSSSPTTSPSTSPAPSGSPSAEPSPSASPTASPTPSPSGEVLGDCDVEANLSNTNTGPNSTNINEVTVNCQDNQTETNQGEVTNTITVDADTGGNQQNGNTQAGNTQTGNVTIDLNIDNSVNNQ